MEDESYGQKAFSYIAAFVAPSYLISQSVADVLLCIVAISFLVRSVLKKEWKWTGDPWFRLCFLTWGWLLVISFLASFDKESSFGRAIPWIRFILFAAAFKYWLFPKKNQDYRPIYILLAATILFTVIDLWVQYLSGQSIFGNISPAAGRLTGPFRSHLVPGTYLAKWSLPLMGWLYLALNHRSTSRTLSACMCAAAGSTIAITIFITGERMAFLTYITAFALLFIFMAGKRLLIPLGMAMLGAALLLLKTNASLMGRVTLFTNDLSNFWESAYGVIFIRSLELFRENPFFGVGLKNFRYASVSADFAGQYHPHNPYLEWAVETGLVGLLLFLLLIGVAGWKTFSAVRKETDSKRIMAASMWLALFMFLWPFMSSMSLFSNWNAIIFWFIMAWGYSMSAPSTRPERVTD